MARAKMRGVPKDELVLAEALANAEKCSLKFRTHSVGLDSDGRYLRNGVCVIGAYRCGKPAINNDHMSAFTRETGFPFTCVYYGNDDSGSVWYDSSIDQGETIGYAFRVAMTEIE